MAELTIQQIRNDYPAVTPIDPDNLLIVDQQIDQLVGSQSTVATLSELIATGGRTVTTAIAYETLYADSVVNVSASSITITVGSAMRNGSRLLIRRTSAYDGNPVTITPPAGTTIEGLTEYRLYEQYASVTIERVSETVFAIVGEGIQKITEVGKIEAFCCTVPKGFKACDGSAISRATFPALFSAVGTTFGAGDGSTTFNLPDARETVLVGTGTRGAGVTSHDTYTLGQFKDDQMQGHRHNWTSVAPAINAAGSGGLQGAAAVATANIGDPTPDTANGTPRVGSTTHGKQLGVNYAIRYA